MEMRILRNFAPGNQIKRYNKYSFKERKIIMLNEINWPEKYLPGTITNKEENIIGDTDILPFMLETELRSHGAIYEQSDPWQVYPCTVDASGTKHRRMSISVEPSTCG